MRVSKLLETTNCVETELKLRYLHHVMTRAKTKGEIIKELFDPSHYDPDTRPGEGTIPIIVSIINIIIISNIISIISIISIIGVISISISINHHIDYDSDENSGPTEVMVNIYVRDFQHIDILKMEMGLQITFRYALQFVIHKYKYKHK